MKETDESMTRVDSSVPLMYHDPDRYWITDPDPDHPKETHPELKIKTPPPKKKYTCASHICRAWYNWSYTMIGKPMKTVELHYLMIQVLYN